MSGCSDTRVENCLVRNMGRGGISSSGGSKNHIIGCEVTRTGSKAVSMSGGDRKSLTRGDCSVVGNHLHHLGRYDWGGGRGFLLGGCGNRAANNLIHHCPTGGIAYSGNEHVLELNEVHHVCQLYSDVGVFYTGRDWASRGNVVRWNYIHSNTNNEGHGSQAIYLDDCDSGDVVTGNIVFGGVGRGVLLGGGRDNILQGNIFIACEKPFALSGNVKEEWLTREGNREWPANKFAFIPDPASEDPLDLDRLPEVWKNVPGFDPIPVEKIGLKGWKK